MQLIPLILTILFMGTLLYIAKNPSKTKYDVKETLPATLYRTNAEPLNILVEKTWHPDDEIWETLNDKDHKNDSVKNALKLPLIQIPDKKEPITIAFDYSGQNTTDQKQLHSTIGDIVIKTTLGCPSEIPCSIAENKAVEVIETAKFNLGTEFVDLTKLSNKQVFEYGGWLQFNTQDKNRFVYHQIFTVMIPNPTSAQFDLHLSVPQGIHTDYLKITVAQGNITYSKPAFFGNKAAQLGKMLVLWITCVFIIFRLLHQRFGETPDNSPKTFATLLIIWGTFLLSVGLFEIHGFTINFLIIQGVLIACAGSLILYRIYFGLIVLIIAMILSWLISFYLSLTINDLLIRTGMITFATAYAFFSSVKSKLG
jgi:hypothetical protein